MKINNLSEKYLHYIFNNSPDLKFYETLMEKYNNIQSHENRKWSPSLLNNLLNSETFNYDNTELISLINNNFLLEDQNLSDLDILLLSLLLIQPLSYLYSIFGIPEKILTETLSDIFLRANLHSNKGLPIKEYNWLARIFRLSIFKLDELQFEFTHFDPSTLPEKTYFSELGKQVLTPNLPIISIHIMQDSKIDINHTTQALSIAKLFHQEFFSEFECNYFYCASWLLYPKNSLLLSDKSKILQFSTLFDIVGQSESQIMALERIFGCSEIESKKVPKNTSLQRAALNNPKALGVGIGLIQI